MISKSLHFLILLFWSFSIIAQDSNEELQVIDSLNNRASEILFIQTDSSQTLALQALELSQTLKDSLRIANSAHNLGLSHHVRGEYDQAINYYQQAIELRKGSVDSARVAGLINNIASIYTSRGDFSRALSLYQESLTLKMNAKDKKGVANTLNNIGIVHYESNNFQSAIDYYERALKIRIELKEDASIAASYGNIGLVYHDMGDFEQSLLLYQSGFDLVEKSEEICNRTYLANGLGFAHMGLGNFEKSKFYSQMAYDDALVCNDPTIMATALNNLGKVNMELKKWYLAEKQLLEAVRIGLDNKLYSELKDLTYSLYNYYKNTGQFEKAMTYLEDFVSIQDSIESKEVTKKITTLELTYAFEKEKDSINFTQQRELLTYAAESNRQRVIRNYTSLVLGLTIVIIVILIRLYLIKQRSAEILSEKNDLINLALKEKEILFREIHHRVKNNLQIISSMLNIQRKTIDQPKTEKALKDAQNRVLAMSLVHDSLYASEQINSISTDQYLNELIDTLEEAMCPPHIQIKRAIEKVILKADDAINIGLLINELFTNAVKYAFEDVNQSGEISISLKEETDNLTMIVSDNGIGMPNVDETSSFGMNIIKSVVDSLRGELIISSDNGTKIQITIPTQP